MRPNKEGKCPTLLSLNVASNKLDDDVGRHIADCLEENYTLIHLDFSFNAFHVHTSNRIKELLRRNVAMHKDDKLREWRERKLMREEDADLHKFYLKDQTDNARGIMEEESFAQKEVELKELYIKKEQEYQLERL
jgi:hypothetical protein